MSQELELSQKTNLSAYMPNNKDAGMIKESAFDQDTKAVMLRAVAIRFCDLNVTEQVNLITNELEQAYIRNGTDKGSEEGKSFTVKEIIEIFGLRKQITHKEISYIFRQGSLGLYGKNFGINVKSINDWIVAFYEDESRKLAIRKLNDLKKASEAIKEFTPAEAESLKIKMIKEIYFDRKQNGFNGTEMLSHPVYDILKTKGIIKLSEKQKTDLMEEAKDMIERAKAKNVSFSKVSASILYAEFESDVTKVAKVLAVRDYFNDISQRNMDLPL